MFAEKGPHYSSGSQYRASPVKFQLSAMKNMQKQNDAYGREDVSGAFYENILIHSMCH
jgi:hypothetical protein